MALNDWKIVQGFKYGIERGLYEEIKKIYNGGLATGVIATGKLANGAITVLKLADNAVESAKIKDGAVTTAKVADKGVTKAKMAVFISAEQTGTGAEQEITHDLGAVPTLVLWSPTLNKDGADCSFAEGTHTADKIKMTVTTGAKYKVIAML